MRERSPGLDGRTIGFRALPVNTRGAPFWCLRFVREEQVAEMQHHANRPWQVQDAYPVTVIVQANPLATAESATSGKQDRIPAWRFTASTARLTARKMSATETAAAMAANGGSRPRRAAAIQASTGADKVV